MIVRRFPYGCYRVDLDLIGVFAVYQAKRNPEGRQYGREPIMRWSLPSKSSHLTRWRTWAILVSMLALSSLLIHFIVDHLTRDPPNYDQIEPGLFLGGYVIEPPPGIEAVLNLCETDDPYRATIHRWEPISDATPVPSLEWLQQQVEFIDAQHREGRAIYVHCRNGVSRSGMVVVAYIMWRNRWSREEAMMFVRSRRPGLRPNPAFVNLLAEWESLLRPR